MEINADHIDQQDLQVRLIRVPASSLVLALHYSPGNNRYYLLFVLGGVIEVVSGKEALEAFPCEIYIISGNCVIKAGPEQPVKLCLLCCSEEFCSKAIYDSNEKGLKLLQSNPLKLIADTVSFKIIRKLLLLLDRHQKGSVSINSPLICQLTFNLLLSCLTELETSMSFVLQKTLTRKEFMALEFLKLVSKQAAAHHDVRYYAEALCMTQGNLTKIIKGVTGKAPKAIIEETILRISKDHLGDSTSSIYVIAEALGFRSSSAFINFFRIHTGITPNEYRKRKK